MRTHTQRLIEINSQKTQRVSVRNYTRLTVTDTEIFTHIDTHSKPTEMPSILAHYETVSYMARTLQSDTFRDTETY